MVCDFHIKNIPNKKRLLIFYIEVDSRNLAEYSPIYDISAMVGSVSLWIFGMIFGHQSRMKKNRINRKYYTFAMHL